MVTYTLQHIKMQNNGVHSLPQKDRKENSPRYRTHDTTRSHPYWLKTIRGPLPRLNPTGGLPRHYPHMGRIGSKQNLHGGQTSPPTR